MFSISDQYSGMSLTHLYSAHVPPYFIIVFWPFHSHVYSLTNPPCIITYTVDDTTVPMFPMTQSYHVSMVTRLSVTLVTGYRGCWQWKLYRTGLQPSDTRFQQWRATGDWSFHSNSVWSIALICVSMVTRKKENAMLSSTMYKSAAFNSRKDL